VAARPAWLVVAAACGAHDASSPPPAPARQVAAESPAPAAWSCTALPFAGTTPVPEASAAAWLSVDGKDVLVTIGDSGRDGAYGLIDPGSGATLEQGKLPLGDAGDDLEGLATRDGVVYGLTSAGWMRAWTRDGNGFRLIDGPYPLGPVDLSDKNLHDRPPEGSGMVCGARGVNCGRNYEGLCLPAHPAGPCTGFVAAKADGRLYCLVDDPAHAGRFAVRREPSLALGRPGTIADCAFAADADDLYVASNLFDTNQVYRVAGWHDLATAKVVPLASVGMGFDEGVAVTGDTVYRFSDMGGAPSLMTKFRCTPAAQ
jgi:hypothetical protein